MSTLRKKRVHWKEKNLITGETYDEDVDILTSADAVKFNDGNNLEEKINSYATNQVLNDHKSDFNNPHNVTPNQIGACTTDDFLALKNLILNENTITSSSNTGYSEVAEWGDGNPNNENRIGYFVSVDNSDSGITMVKATSTSDVRGVTISHPAFAANASEDKFGEDGRLRPKYNYVAFIGFAVVYDYGRCTINGRCISDDNGTAIPSNNTMGYQVMARISDDKVLILMEPNGDMLNRIKTDVTTLYDIQEMLKISDGEYVYRVGKNSNGMYLEVIEIL